MAISTASRALNRTGRVSEETIKHVTLVAQQLGYRPNQIARTMRAKRSHAVGVVVSDLSNPLYGKIIKSLEKAFTQQGYALLIANSNNSLQQEAELIDFFKSRKIDGLILGPCEDEAVEHLDEQLDGLPTVLLDRLGNDDLISVQVDHYLGAKQAIEYLIGLGHERIALMTPGGRVQPGKARVKAYKDVHRKAGLKLDPELIRIEESSMDFSFENTLQLLKPGKQRPTAFICLGTRILAGVLAAVKQRGLSIPDDISLVSIGDTDLSEFYKPAITAVAWDIELLAQTMADSLLQKINSAPDAPASQNIPTELILRESCTVAAR